MADDATATGASWMSDVQKVVAFILIGSIAVATLGAAARVVWIGEPDAVTDMAKTLLAAVINMGLITLGFFYGSTSQKGQADAGQQKIVEKLTSSITAANTAAAGTAAGATVDATPTLDAMADAMLTEKEKEHFAKLTDEDKRKQFMAMTPEQRGVAIQRGA